MDLPSGKREQKTMENQHFSSEKCTISMAVFNGKRSVITIADLGLTPRFSEPRSSSGEMAARRGNLANPNGIVSDHHLDVDNGTPSKWRLSAFVKRGVLEKWPI